MYMNNKKVVMMAHGHGGGHQLQQGDSGPYCSFHPRELVVGVCAHCLKDRLLLLLSASPSAATTSKDKDKDAAFSSRFIRPGLRRIRTSSISLPKVFALGSSFLQRLDSSRHHHHEAGDAYSDDDDNTSVASLDDSFISIKFEDNGKATWDKQQQQQQALLLTGGGGGAGGGGGGGGNNKAAAAAAPATRSSSSSSTAVVAVVEHVKRGGVTRWRKQVVGRLLQLARWKRSAAVVVGMDGKKKKAAAAATERSKARGWIRSLTRRRAAAAHGDRAWS